MKPAKSWGTISIYSADDRVELRIYFLKASEFQRPSWRICASDKPWAAAEVAAPILKLCEVKRAVANLQNISVDLRCALNCDLVTGVRIPGVLKKSGPGLAPLTATYSFMILTGHAPGCPALTVTVTDWDLLCLYFIKVMQHDSVELNSICFSSKRFGLFTPGEDTVISPMRKKA